MYYASRGIVIMMYTELYTHLDNDVPPIPEGWLLNMNYILLILTQQKYQIKY